MRTLTLTAALALTTFAGAQTARYDYVEQPLPYGWCPPMLTALTRPTPSTGLTLEVRPISYGPAPLQYFLVMGTQAAWTDLRTLPGYGSAFGSWGGLMTDPMVVFPIQAPTEWTPTVVHMVIPNAAALAGVALRQQVLTIEPQWLPSIPMQIRLGRLGIATCGF